MKISRRIQLLILSLLLVFTISSGVIAADNNVLEECRNLIVDNYYKDVPKGVITSDNIPDMMKALGDPYSVYMTKGEYADFQGSISGDDSGLGFDVFMDGDGSCIVNYVINDSPADKRGIKVSDKLLAINDRPIRLFNYLQAYSYLTAPEGISVKVTMESNGVKKDYILKSINLTYPVLTWDVIDDHIIYIRLFTFSEDSHKKVLDAVEKGLAIGGDSVILDLRNNLGGYTYAAAYIASFFTASDDIMTLVSRGDSEAVERYCDSLGLPSVILTNGYSASSSEIVSGAISEGDMGIVVGTQTYGKGLMQDVYTLSNGDVLKLTIAEFRTPKGKIINGVGIKPKYEEVSLDKQMSKAIDILSNGNENSYIFRANLYRVDIGSRSETMESYPVVVNGSFMVPARAVAKVMNLDFAVSQTGEFIYTNKETKETIRIAKNSKYKKGYYLDPKQSVAMIPAKAFFNKLNYDVIWSKANKSIDVVNK